MGNAACKFEILEQELPLELRRNTSSITDDRASTHATGGELRIRRMASGVELDTPVPFAGSLL